jgi:uncharacterized protein YecT (DUF1311 family)
MDRRILAQPGMEWCEKQAPGATHKGPIRDKNRVDLRLPDICSPPAIDRREFRLRKGGQRPERMICTDAALSAADAKLAGLYTAALQRFSERGRHQLRDDQRVWLHYLAEVCPLSANAETAERPESCMEIAYDERTQDFEQIAVMKGPFLFTGVYRYSVTRLKEKRGPYDTGLAKHKVSYPRIDSPVNSITVEWNRKQIPKGDIESGCDAGDGDTFTTYRLGLVNARLISVTKSDGEYCHGTPHGFGNSSIETLVLFPSPHVLRSNDIFRNGAPWQERLSDLALDSIRKASAAEHYTLEQLDTEAIARIVADPPRWTLQQGGLALMSNPYELGLGYAIHLDITIPWSELRDLMVRNPPVP